MRAKRKDLTIERGETWKFSPRFKDSTGVPVDLTGFSATIDLYSKGVLEDTWTATVTNDGYMHFKVEKEVTVALDDVYYYNLDLIDSNGDVTRLAFGDLKARGLA